MDQTNTNNRSVSVEENVRTADVQNPSQTTSGYAGTSAAMFDQKQPTEKQLEYRQKINSMVNSLQPMSAFKEEFVRQCKEYGTRISTGINSLDIVLNGGLSDELYIMAAETSTGKSAFMMDLAQNVARGGSIVLYFALEMSRKEFVARAISMISYMYHKEDPANAFTAGDVLDWRYEKEDTASAGIFTKVSYSMYEKYSDEYFEQYGKNLYIIEGEIEGLSAKDIANICATMKKRNPMKKIVAFIDYLQLVKADPDDRSQIDRKTKTDVSVTVFKALASQIGMPVFLLSSVSRGNYGSQIGTSSFKESGDTEYTGGILIGWNWEGVTNEKDADARKEEIESCKKRKYRRMVLDILKYRNSERDKSVHLRYYPAYNYFEEDFEKNKKDSAGSNTGPTKDVVIRNGQKFKVQRS